MSSNLEKYIKEVSTGFQRNKGRASVYCFHPISYADLILNLITQFYNKHPDDQVFIIVDCYNTRKSILDRLCKENAVYNVKILSADYIKDNYKYTYKFIITVGINDNTALIKFLKDQAKFMLVILTKNLMNNEFTNSVRQWLPPIEITVSDASVRSDSIYLPVEEYRVGVSINSHDKELYDKCSEYIATSVSIFGELSNIEKCKYGDTVLNISSAEFRDNIAKQNGWSTTLDTSLDWSKQIDEVYNPNVLFERANNFYNITKQRRDLVTDNIAKIEAIIQICVDNEGKKILIVSKRGEFASTITKYINDVFKDNNKFKCGDYHDAIESTIAVDEYGVTQLTKGGKSKGKPKIIGSQAISTLNMKRFNSSMINVLSIKNSSSIKLEIAVDLVIFSSPFVDEIISFKTRFANIVFNSVPTITYKVYCIGTIENKQLTKQKESRLITVINDNENFIGYDETNGDIIL